MEKGDENVPAGYTQKSDEDAAAIHCKHCGKFVRTKTWYECNCCERMYCKKCADEDDVSSNSHRYHSLVLAAEAADEKAREAWQNVLHFVEENLMEMIIKK